MIRKYSFVLILSIMVIQPISAQEISDFTKLTWADTIQKDDTYEWMVTTLKENGSSVTDATNYGVKEGSIIKIETLVKLSEINLIEYLNGTEFTLPPVTDLIRLTVDGINGNFTIYQTVIFIIPTVIEFQGGNVNSFFLASQANVTFFSNSSKFIPQSNVYIESQDGGDKEQFKWNFQTGILQLIELDYANGFELLIEFIPLETPVASDSGFLIINPLIPIFSFFVLLIIRKRMKTI